MSGPTEKKPHGNIGRQHALRVGKTGARGWVRLRAPVEDVDRWQAEASRAGMTFSEWVRMRLG